jgi:hypothetical protein
MSFEAAAEFAAKFEVNSVITITATSEKEFHKRREVSRLLYL